jgi:hypothetical protein
VREVRRSFGGWFCARILVGLALMVCAGGVARAQTEQELIVDGGLDLGAVGWGVATTDDGNPNNGTATWFLSQVGDPSPLSGLETSSDGNASGLYLVTDQQIASRLAVFQIFTIPQQATYERVILSFDMYVNDYANVSAFNPDQYVTVDVMGGDADPLDLQNNIIYNVYTGTDGGPLPNPFFRHTFDITGYVNPEERYMLRFLANVNVSVLNVGVDNVSVRALVPEPSSWILAVGIGAVVARRTRRR